MDSSVASGVRSFPVLVLLLATILDIIRRWVSSCHPEATPLIMHLSTSYRIVLRLVVRQCSRTLSLSLTEPLTICHIFAAECVAAAHTTRSRHPRASIRRRLRRDDLCDSGTHLFLYVTRVTSTTPRWACPPCGHVAFARARGLAMVERSLLR